MLYTPDMIARRIVRVIQPLVAPVTAGGEAKLIRKRMRDAIVPVLREIGIDNDATVAEADARTVSAETTMAQMQASERADADRRVEAQKTQDAADCRALRQADATSADMAKTAAVAAARQEEKDACTSLRQSDAAAATKACNDAVAAARSDEQQKCATLRAQDAAAAGAAQTSAVNAAKAAEQQACATLRAQDAAAAATAQANAVAAARAEEKAAAATAQANAVAAARTDEQQKCAALRSSDAAAAETKRLADVAAARKSERTIILGEINAAPVTGITVALTLFAASMREQIRTYVSKGPY